MPRGYDRCGCCHMLYMGWKGWESGSATCWPPASLDESLFLRSQGSIRQIPTALAALISDHRQLGLGRSVSSELSLQYRRGARRQVGKKRKSRCENYRAMIQYSSTMHMWAPWEVYPVMHTPPWSILRLLSDLQRKCRCLQVNLFSDPLLLPAFWRSCSISGARTLPASQFHSLWSAESLSSWVSTLRLAFSTNSGIQPVAYSLSRRKAALRRQLQEKGVEAAPM